MKANRDLWVFVETREDGSASVYVKLSHHDSS